MHVEFRRRSDLVDIRGVQHAQTARGVGWLRSCCLRFCRAADKTLFRIEPLSRADKPINRRHATHSNQGGKYGAETS